MSVFQIILLETAIKEFKPIIPPVIANASDIDTDFYRNQIIINDTSKSLIDVKKQITIEIIKKSQEVWDRITSRFEFSKPLKYKIKSLNIGLPPNISNAFLKALEIFKHIQKPDPLYEDYLFDNASLPGDFIRAWIFLGGNSNWRANSLIGEGALEDRFNLYKKNPEKWMMSFSNKLDKKEENSKEFLKKMNGDITLVKNIQTISNKLSDEKFNITIYTSDLGFAIKDPFNEENEHYWPNFGQILLGLKILTPGIRSTMVIKMFTALENKSHYIIQICMSKFDQLHIFKPETSKRDNSEMYIIGIGYKGISEDELQSLEFMLKNKILYPIIHWDTQITNVMKTLVDGQIEKIKANISAFQSYKSPPNMDDKIQIWIDKFLSVKKI